MPTVKGRRGFHGLPRAPALRNRDSGLPPPGLPPDMGGHYTGRRHSHAMQRVDPRLQVSLNHPHLAGKGYFLPSILG